MCDGAVDAERIARVFHGAGRIHRPLGPGGAVARVDEVIVGVVVVGSVVMSSSSGGWPVPRASVASSGP